MYSIVLIEFEDLVSFNFNESIICILSNLNSERRVVSHTTHFPCLSAMRQIQKSRTVSKSFGVSVCVCLSKPNDPLKNNFDYIHQFYWDSQPLDRIHLYHLSFWCLFFGFGNILVWLWMMLYGVYMFVYMFVNIIWLPC